MKKFNILIMALCCVALVQARNYGIAFGDKVEVSDANAKNIFGDGKASYEASSNTLVLKEGFRYSLGKGLVVISTGRPLTIRVEGESEIKAAVKSNDDLRIVGSPTLSVTSNISGSAIECPNLTIEDGANVVLLSRNSQEGMFALKCGGTLTVNHATLKADVTTAYMAVVLKAMTLNKAVLQRPKGGIVSEEHGCISMGDGLPAKMVRIVPEE